MPTTVPERSESAEYYFNYIDQVPAGDIREVVSAQLAEAVTLCGSISEEQSLHRYAPGKWTIREVLSHINDTERVFMFRAFWFARALEHELPSFDQDRAIPAAGANGRTWASHVEEFKAIRASTIAFWQTLPADAWTRQGIASGNYFSVRALGYITVGHVAHHLRLLRELYL